ncbi:MAG TPA: CvpA family protein [Gemmataceae bacterium]|nr:CvpA family protein [Gemmataceae bacterium]
MHWLDSTILAVLAAAAVLGAYSGLLMQVFRLVGFVVAVYAATLLHEPATAWLREKLLRGAEPEVVSAVAYGSLFLGIYVAIFLFTLMLERGVRATQLQYLNRALGAALALAKMSLLIGGICYGLQQFGHEETNRLLAESAVAPLLARGVEQTVAAIPAEHKKDWTAGWNPLSQGLQLPK